MSNAPRTGSARAVWRSYVTGPRWAKFSTAIRDRVWADPDLELVACEDEKGWLHATTRFDVRGPRGAVEAFQRDILNSIADWNGR